jgi:hypothetical protein
MVGKAPVDDSRNGPRNSLYGSCHQSSGNPTSAGANPPPPGVLFHSTAVNGTPSARSAAFAAALKGQYVALNTAP